METTTEKLSKYEGLGAAMAAKLMWFGIGVILAVKMVCCLNDCIEEVSRKCQ